jgi:hypothetical protein
MADETPETNDASPKGKVTVRDISEIVEDACPIVKGDGPTEAYHGSGYPYFGPKIGAASAAYKAKILPLAIKDVSTYCLKKGA